MFIYADAMNIQLTKDERNGPMTCLTKIPLCHYQPKLDGVFTNWYRDTYSSIIQYDFHVAKGFLLQSILNADCYYIFLLTLHGWQNKEQNNLTAHSIHFKIQDIHKR